MYNVQTGAKASDNQIASLALPEGQWRGAKSTVPKPGASRGGAVDGLVGTSVALFATFSKKTGYRPASLCVSLALLHPPPSLQTGGG